MAESLRERKKARTREELVRVSQRLFHKQGFTATTLDQICEEVEVVPQTLLRYFDSKHKLALAPLYDAYREFAAEMTSPDRALDALGTWTEFALRRAEHAMADPRACQLAHTTPELRNAQFDILLSYESLLDDSLASEAGRDELDAKLLSCLLAAGEHAVYRRWLDEGATGDLRAEVALMIDRAAAAFPRSAAASSPDGRYRAQP